MAPTPPATLADFKSRFSRDFQFGAGLDKVQDNDVTIALSDAVSLFNPSLFNSVDGKAAFLFAAAHLLVMNVQAAGGLGTKNMGLGMQNAPEELLASKGVGGINMSMVEPPEFVVGSTLLRQFWSTDYGRRYLMMLEPKLKGAFGVVRGPDDTGSVGGPSVPFSDWS